MPTSRYEYVPDEKQPYLVMEFIDGTDLRDLLEENGPFGYDRFSTAPGKSLMALNGRTNVA